MNNIADEILREREEKSQLINSYLNDYDVITLKANIPGSNKQLNIAYILINYFHHQLIDRFKFINYLYFDDVSGPMYLYLVKKQQIKKEDLIKIEETKYGRFIDIDLFINGINRSVNRNQLRKCYLCGEDAFICSRMKKHSYEELINYLNQQVRFLLREIINECIITSMEKELNLDPKFGLVTPTSNGSHNDMNYEMMKQSIMIIKDDLIEMFFNGYDHQGTLNELFNLNRKLGILTEQKMFKQSLNVNTYKGLIFILGQTLGSLGYALKNKKDFNSIFTNLKEMGKDLINELKQPSFVTKGVIAYQKYGIEGARGEIKNGLLSVRNLLAINDMETNDDLLNALVYLIINIDDTVFLNRAGSIERYQLFKKYFKELNINDGESINQLNKMCIENNLSFGGCADLLIVSIFLKMINNRLF